MSRAKKVSLSEVAVTDLIPGLEVVNIGRIKSLKPNGVWGKDTEPIKFVDIEFEAPGKFRKEMLDTRLYLCFPADEKVLVRIPEPPGSMFNDIETVPKEKLKANPDLPSPESVKEAITTNEPIKVDPNEEGLVDWSYLKSEKFMKASEALFKSIGVIKQNDNE